MGNVEGLDDGIVPCFSGSVLSAGSNRAAAGNSRQIVNFGVPEFLPPMEKPGKCDCRDVATKRVFKALFSYTDVYWVGIFLVSC